MARERLVPCDECGAPFVARSARHRFCSSACRYRWRDRRDYTENREAELERKRHYYLRNRERVIARVKAYQARRRSERSE